MDQPPIENIKNGLKVDVNPATGAMTISIIKDGAIACSTDIPIKEASTSAAVLLAAAKTAFEMSGKQQLPETLDPTSFPNLVPSGLGLGPSHIENCDSLIFYFGETALGLSIPRAQAAEVGQSLMALGALGAKH